MKHKFTNSDKEITLTLRPLSYYDLPQVMALQDEIISDIDPELFQKSYDWEIIDSIENDYCCGLFDGEMMVAFCVMIFNRKTERNYCCLTDDKEDYSKYFSFDTIQVKKEYRGFGIQRFFLLEADREAKKQGAEFVLATVAPDNKYSLNSFINAGYSIYMDKEIDAYNSKRYLMMKKTSN